jgi:hypothetical protein
MKTFGYSQSNLTRTAGANRVRSHRSDGEASDKLSFRYRDNITIDARGATPGMEQKLLDTAEVIAHRVVDVRSPSIVAAAARTVRISRKNMGMT